MKPKLSCCMLQELLDAEKEERKLKREAERAAKKAKEAPQKGPQGDGSAAESAAQDAANASAPAPGLFFQKIFAEESGWKNYASSVCRYAAMILAELDDIQTSAQGQLK